MHRWIQMEFEIRYLSTELFMVLDILAGILAGIFDSSLILSFFYSVLLVDYDLTTCNPRRYFFDKNLFNLIIFRHTGMKVPRKSAIFQLVIQLCRVTPQSLKAVLRLIRRGILPPFMQYFVTQESKVGNAGLITKSICTLEIIDQMQQCTCKLLHCLYYELLLHQRIYKCTL